MGKNNFKMETLAELWLKKHCCLLPQFDNQNADRLIQKYGMNYKDGLKIIERVRTSIRRKISGFV